MQRRTRSGLETVDQDSARFMTDSTHTPFRWTEPVAHLDGVGPKRAELLKRLGVESAGDLLYHFPRDYQDRSTVTPIAEAWQGERVTVYAAITSIRSQRLRNRKSMAVATLEDGSGAMGATWFGRGFLARALKPGQQGFFTGTVGNYKGPVLQNPEYEITDEEDGALHGGRVVPIYSLTDGVTQRMLRQWIRAALDRLLDALPDPLPEAVRAEHGWPGLREPFEHVHFPADVETGRRASERFAYEELFVLQLGLLKARQERAQSEDGITHRTDGPHLARLQSRLPFALTNAQARARDDILADMAAPRPMARLIQGDVGCGKTVVALHAVAAAVDSGCQAAVMAPTEVLAEQHFHTLHAALTPLGIPVGLLTGSSPAPKQTRSDLATGLVKVVVGTQALMQDATAFARLGLVIVDEQHRFGVMQRAALAGKGRHADLLHMTATPIPRSLVLTLYGSMDLTVIDEMPPGRLPVKTRRIPPEKEADLMGYLRNQAEAGFQTYYICPLIEESEAMDLTPVTRRYDELRAGPLAGVATALLHGRMAPDEKDAVLRQFREGAVKILFSTSVIEVGIDVPQATTMVIEDAAQFGMTQLHQLRGRVGRGMEQSYCFLLGTPRTEQGEARLRTLCATADGFAIAEADLEMRGPGEFQGARQAGISELKAADLLRDTRLLDWARRDAAALLAADPALNAPEHALLARDAARYSELAL